MSDTQTKEITPINELRGQVMSPATAQQLQMVLPKHIGVEKFQRVVMTAVSKNQDLIGADRSSLLNSCIECATDGLIPDSKQAALVMFGKKAVYMPMIAGIYKLARNSGELKILYADIVHANDHFVYEKGFDVKCEHKPNIDDPGEIRGVYAVAETKDGTRYADYMPNIEVEKVRATSRSKDKGPWVTFWAEMAKKTVVRRLSKVLPLTPEIERMVQSVDAMYDFENSREMKDVTTPPPAPDRQEYIETAPEHMSDALDGADDEPDDEAAMDESNLEDGEQPADDKSEEAPGYEFRILRPQGNVINCDSIQEWHDQILDDLSNIKTIDGVEKFRQRQGTIFMNLDPDFHNEVMLVGKAIDEKKKALENK